jgi:hypothetical protein
MLSLLGGLKTYMAPMNCEFSQGVLTNPNIENLHITNHILTDKVFLNLKLLKVTVSDYSKFYLAAFETCTVKKLVLELLGDSEQNIGYRSQSEQPPASVVLQKIVSKAKEINLSLLTQQRQYLNLFEDLFR